MFTKDEDIDLEQLKDQFRWAANLRVVPGDRDRPLHDLRIGDDALNEFVVIVRFGKPERSMLFAADNVARRQPRLF